jgi:hypothetical protein
MTRLLEILISLAIVAALFLIVGVILPSSRHLSEDIETNRKMTIVYDTLNTPRRLKDWNTIAFRDPNMQWEFSGPESGVGARADYASDVPQIGRGSWEITASEPGQRVEYAITNPERGHDKRTAFLLKPTGRNNRNVKITQTYDVDYGWNLMGRYAGLYVDRSVGDDITFGLNKLTNMLAGVPNYDYATLDRQNPAHAPRMVELPAQNLLFVSVTVPRDNERIEQTIQNNLQWIRKVIDANGLEQAGPLRIVTTEFGTENYAFDTAMPVRKKGTGPAAAADEADAADEAEGDGEAEATASPAPAAAPTEAAPVTPKLEGPVEFVRTEPGRFAVAGYTGHMAGLPRVRDALRAWALTRGYETTGRPFETWKNGATQAFTEEGEFDVYWTLK